MAEFDRRAPLRLEELDELYKADDRKLPLRNGEKVPVSEVLGAHLLTVTVDGIDFIHEDVCRCGLESIPQDVRTQEDIRGVYIPLETDPSKMPSASKRIGTRTEFFVSALLRQMSN